MNSNISNPASALGEAIGKLVEEAIKQHMNEKFIQKHKELKLIEGKIRDSNNVPYDIDMIIQKCKDIDCYPIGLIEVKFLRYKKHMRDKASWITHAFRALRETYPTIIFTLAVLIGDWTKGSKDMLKKSGIEIVEIPFNKVVDIFEKYNVNVNWSEKEREKAQEAWKSFSELSEEDKRKIGLEIIKDYIDKIIGIVESKYQETKTMETISHVLVTLYTNVGRVIQLRCVDISKCEEIINDLKKIKEGKWTVQDLIESIVQGNKQQRRITNYIVKS